MSTDFGRTFRQLPVNIDPKRPTSVYVVREDPYNANLLYIGTELGVWASLDKGSNWFELGEGLPTVPVYDLAVHPRDRELIAGTHGRGVMILDVAPLEQMSARAVAANTAQLFQPATAYQYAQPPAGSEPRAHRPWRVDGGPDGAVIWYRLPSRASAAPKISIVNAAGDTVARLNGDQDAGLNSVTWNFVESPNGAVAGGGGGRGGRGGRGGFQGPVNDPGFPAGFNPRPAESRAAPDSSGSPTAPAATGGGGRGRGGRGGRGNTRTADTGDYRVVMDVDGRISTTVLRVVKVPPGSVSVMPQ